MREEEAVVLVFILAALVVVIAALFYRYRKQQMLHQERMAALEKGSQLPQAYSRAPWSPRVYLLRGLLWSFAGAALCIFLLGVSIPTQRPQSAETVVWRANNLSRDAAISIQEAKKIIESDPPSRQAGMPLAVALLGLIPVAVGAAYLVFYFADSKRNIGVQE